MKRAWALLFFVVLATASFAQMDMTRMGSMQSTPAMAMMRPDVKKELKLTKEQSSAIDKINKDLQQSMRTAGMESLKKIDEASEQIVALLTEPQKKRLFEIRIQMQGPPGLGDAEIAKLLELTEEQQSKVKSLQSAYMSELMKNAQSGGRSGMEAMKKASEAHDAKLLEVLTEAQRTKYKEIQGAPFKNARPKGSIF